MNDKLSNAARMLEAKPLEFEQHPPEKIRAETWNAVEQQNPGLVPVWYKDLLQTFRIGGAIFEYPIPGYQGATTTYCFYVLRPSEIIAYLSDYPMYSALYEHGYFGFADGECSTSLVFVNNSAPDPLVYFCASTDWDGATISIGNGLTPLNVTLSELLTRAVNSEE